jgi:hypothetical protein
MAEGVVIGYVSAIRERAKPGGGRALSASHRKALAELGLSMDGRDERPHAGGCTPPAVALEDQAQRELNLAWNIGAGGGRQVRGSAVVRWKVVDANGFIDLREVGGCAGEAVVADLYTLVVAVQSVEGFHHQFEFVAGPDIETAS